VKAFLLLRIYITQIARNGHSARMDIYGTETRFGRDGTQAMKATGSMGDAEILSGETESKKKTCDFSQRSRSSLLAGWRSSPAKIVPLPSEM
jgi:hypothetical protein